MENTAMSGTPTSSTREFSILETAVFNMILMGMLAALLTLVIGMFYGMNILEDARRRQKAETLAYYDRVVRTASIPSQENSRETLIYYWPSIARYLDSLDFRQFCSPNGFDRTTADPQTLPCYGTGNYRVVRDNGSYTFFRHDADGRSEELTLTSRSTNDDTDVTNVNILLRGIQPAAAPNRKAVSP